MFNKKRLSRVVITFQHGDLGLHIPPQLVIELLPGQSFHKGLGSDYIEEHRNKVKEFDWRAGFTVIYEYFYQ